MRKLILGPALVLGASLVFLPELAAQPPKPEDIAVTTPDGLQLSGQWFKGANGKNSDSVLLLHNYGPAYSSGKGEWANLAATLQKEGYSVLMFDFRGHGLNKGAVKSMRDATKFCMSTFNTLAGAGPLNPQNPPKSLDVTKFSPVYYPFLINDIAGARNFLDRRNDAGECNSGRIYIVADREICPLAFYWAGIEFNRNGKFPAIPGADAPRYDAGTDIMGIVCLSYRNHDSFKFPYDGLVRTRLQIHNGLKDKVSALFLDHENSSHAGASYWFSKWGIINGKKEDKTTGKYLVSVEKSEKLSGIDLLAPKNKLGVDKMIVDFIDKTNKKKINGNDWSTRNAGVVEIVPVPIQDYGGPVR